MSFFGDDDCIFDAYAEFTGEVDAGFYGADHIGLQGFFFEGGVVFEGGRFMDFESYAMAGAMGEEFFVAGVFDDVSCGFIEVRDFCSGFTEI